jgi:hypothetical protein
MEKGANWDGKSLEKPLDLKSVVKIHSCFFLIREIALTGSNGKLINSLLSTPHSSYSLH